MKCVIPCGGSSSRLGWSKNKVLVEVCGKPVIAHVVNFWRSIGIEDFVFIVGGSDAEGVVRAVHRTGLSSYSVVDRKNIVNLTSAIQLAKDYVGQKFILALGDCLNIGTFTTQNIKDFGVGVWETSDLDELNKNYLVEVSHATGLVKDLIEKPNLTVPYGNCGMGTFFLHRKFFDYADRLSLLPLRTSVDLTGAIQLAISEGEEVSPVYFEGEYINVTSQRDIEKAERIFK